MKLLVSPANVKEAAEAIAGGADIVDVKNPQEGALGANYPWVIRQIKEVTPKNVQVSCTLGEAPNIPGSISLAALGAASLGVDYVKVGLQGLQTEKEILFLLESVNRAAKECNPKIMVVAAGYADAGKVGSINPMKIPEIAHKAKVDVAMIDTAVKDGKNLFDYLSQLQIRKFVNLAHDLGLSVALAGSLRKQDLSVVCCLGADIAGVRGAACTKGDRVSGEISRRLVAELVETVKETEAKANAMRT